MSFGAERIAPGWFEVPPWVLAKLRGAGLPPTPPEPESAPAVPTRLDPPSSGWPWLARLAVLMVGTAAITARHRQPT